MFLCICLSPLCLTHEFWLLLIWSRISNSISHYTYGSKIRDTFNLDYVNAAKMLTIIKLRHTQTSSLEYFVYAHSSRICLLLCWALFEKGDELPPEKGSAETWDAEKRKVEILVNAAFFLKSVYWKCNFLMNPHLSVCLLVGWSVYQNFQKWREVSYSYRSSCCCQLLEHSPERILEGLREVKDHR